MRTISVLGLAAVASVAALASTPASAAYRIMPAAGCASAVAPVARAGVARVGVARVGVAPRYVGPRRIPGWLRRRLGPSRGRPDRRRRRRGRRRRLRAGAAYGSGLRMTPRPRRLRGRICGAVLRLRGPRHADLEPHLRRAADGPAARHADALRARHDLPGRPEHRLRADDGLSHRDAHLHLHDRRRGPAGSCGTGFTVIPALAFMRRSTIARACSPRAPGNRLRPLRHG